jgi:hypothetical protein
MLSRISQEKAAAAKIAGNKFFQAQRFADAITAYSDGLDILGPAPRRGAFPLATVLLSNRAQVLPNTLGYYGFTLAKLESYL